MMPEVFISKCRSGLKTMPSYNYLVFLFLYLFASTVSASPPGYGDGTSTQSKMTYCNALVNRFGHLSYDINRGYYGVGVAMPSRNNWALKNIKRPGWFNKDLYIVYTQTTKEKYEDYEHRAFCRWEPDGFFSFVIEHFDRRGPIICESYATDRERMCP